MENALMTRNVLTLGGLTVALLLAGCNGSSSSSSDNPGSTLPPITTTPPADAQGIWQGSIDTPTAGARQMETIVLSDGSLWMVYSNTNDPASTDPLLNAAGVIQGSGTPNEDGTYTVANGRLVSLEDGSKADAAIAATYLTGSSFNGNITQSGGTTSLPSPATFTGLYKMEYNNNLTLAHLAGNYPGSLTTNLGKHSATLTVDSSGAISGSDSTGCSISGQASQRDRGPVFDVSLTFGSEAGCGANAAVSMNGIFSLETNRAGIIALDDGRAKTFVFVGNR